MKKNNLKRKGSSETTRVVSFFLTEEDFNYWIAGLIDGDGYFGLSLKGYGSCEITLKDVEVVSLYKIKSVLGGKVLPRKGVKAFTKSFKSRQW
jgi:ubiquinol-cytochrome c reductase cytochrome b subunit